MAHREPQTSKLNYLFYTEQNLTVRSISQIITEAQKKTPHPITVCSQPEQNKNLNPGDDQDYKDNMTRTNANIATQEKDQRKRKRAKRPKLRRPTKDVLEQHFNNNTKPSDQEITDLAKSQQLEEKVVRSWFNNRRHRQKKGKRMTVGGPSTSPSTLFTFRDMTQAQPYKTPGRMSTAPGLTFGIDNILANKTKSPPQTPIKQEYMEYFDEHKPPTANMDDISRQLILWNTTIKQEPSRTPTTIKIEDIRFPLYPPHSTQN